MTLHIEAPGGVGGHDTRAAKAVGQKLRVDAAIGQHPVTLRCPPVSNALQQEKSVFTFQPGTAAPCSDRVACCQQARGTLIVLDHASVRLHR